MTNDELEERLDAVHTTVEQCSPRGMGIVRSFRLEACVNSRVQHGWLHEHQNGSWFFNKPGGGWICTIDDSVCMAVLLVKIEEIIRPQYVPNYEI